MNITKLIAENIAPAGAKAVGIFDAEGNLITKAAIPATKQAPTTAPSYSFGVLSDLHLGKSADPNEQEDFRRALRFFNGNTDNGATASSPESRGNGEGLSDFVCAIGDIADTGADSQLTEFATLCATYSPNTPVYTPAGNHDAYSGDINGNWESIVGTEPNFVLTHDDNAVIGTNDVFIFVSVQSYSASHVSNHGLFSNETLLWLYEQLETYRNKRCFVFQHVRPTNGSGNAYGVYTYNIWLTSDEGTVFFEELMNHYKNVVFFHGHSHMRFQFQDSAVDSAKMANYSYTVPAAGGRPAQAFRSIHVPSVANIRQSDTGYGSGSPVYLYYGSEGYKVDVYGNYIILRGRDFNGYDSGTFAEGSLIPTAYGDPAWIPQALYKIDTTLVTVAAGTFTTTTSILDDDTQEPETDENGYYVCEYIEATNGSTTAEQYIDTGIVGALDMEVTADITPTTSTTYGTLIGSTDASDNRCYVMFRSDEKLELGAAAYSRTDSAVYSHGTRYTMVAKWASGDSFVKLDGTTVVTGNSTTLSPTHNLFVCARNGSGTAERPGAFRIYSMQIKKNNVLVADYVPRVDPETMIAGLYDKVSNIFLTSAGTSQFGYSLVYEEGTA